MKKNAKKYFYHKNCKKFKQNKIVVVIDEIQGTLDACVL